MVLRNGGVGQSRLTRELVPGDIIMLLGGVQVPADVRWIEGDQLQVDTAQLTGEGIPRKYPCELYGAEIRCGCTILSGEAYAIVEHTGANTEVGKEEAIMMKKKSQGKARSVFEEGTLRAMTVILVISLIISLIIFIFVGIKDHQFDREFIKKDLLTCLSIIVASIPIALPIVMNVTMSLGAATMAKDFNAVVTGIPALQDIASMSVLCSDKTGTLTTAKMTVDHDEVWCNEGFVRKEIGMYAMLASSRDKAEDAVDRCIVKYFDSVFKTPPPDFDSYKKVGGMGFNPVYKRVVTDLVHPKIGQIRVAKGLAVKVLDTENGGKDDAPDQWKCHDYERLMPKVLEIDRSLSTRGFKTIGVAVKHEDKPWVFCGILPMIDKPRHDSALTVANLNAAGVEVKMITGDHLNIGVETARQINMGMNMYPGEVVRNGTQTSKQLIKEADGFAQVLPSDKREVVEVLRDHWGFVVGMTGDGVNDAPALAAAQCGVAVDDATDAAKNAAAIILTKPGLSAIYMAVLESRRIFRKLKSYVTYRFAASIQIVLVLAALIFDMDCAINPTYIIVLALLNDLTMLPIAYDAQSASSTPEKTDIRKMLITSLTLGILETFFTLLFAYSAGPSQLFVTPMVIDQCPNDLADPDDAPATSKSMQAAIWLQMTIAAELLIFSARAPTHFMVFLAPSIKLVASVLSGCILVCILAANLDYFGKIAGRDIVLIWLYNIICLFIVDRVKVSLFLFLDENLETLADPEPVMGEPEEVEDDVVPGTINDALPAEERMSFRESAIAERMTDKTIATSDRLSQMDKRAARESLIRSSFTASSDKNEATGESLLRGSASSSASRNNSIDRISISAKGAVTTPDDRGSSGLRGSFVNLSGSLRPVTPASRATGKL